MATSADSVHFFGIRHHGPGCARSLLQALEQLQPDCLLVEGPPEGEALLPGVKWIENPYQAANDADLLVLLTEWNEFRALDLPRLAETMAVARMADLRNVYDETGVLEAGFAAYAGVGR